MSFAVPAEAYDRFMGRYSSLLAAQLAGLGAVRAGQAVLDVGCGPGALTEELVRRVGASKVSAVDPSEPFLAAARQRNPGVEFRLASAEQLPFPDARFEVTLAQLVLHLVRDPRQALRELVRVTRPGGRVAACVWDFAGGRSPLSLFWQMARELDPGAPDESALPGARGGQLVAMFREAGLEGVEGTELSLTLDHETFESWWQPFTFGVGPAGDYLRQAGEARANAIRERCRDVLTDGPFTVRAVAWAAQGTVR